jgi:hypothetical protein
LDGTNGTTWDAGIKPLVAGIAVKLSTNMSDSNHQYLVYMSDGSVFAIEAKNPSSARKIAMRGTTASVVVIRKA